MEGCQGICDSNDQNGRENMGVIKSMGFPSLYTVGKDFIFLKLIYKIEMIMIEVNVKLDLISSF